MAKEKIGITLAVQSDFSAVESDLKQLQGKMANLGLPGLETKDFSHRLEDLRTKVEAFKELDGKEISLKSDFKDIQRDLKTTDEEAEELLKIVRVLSRQTEEKKLSLLPENQQKKIAAATNAVKKYTEAIEKLKKQQNDVRSQEELVASNKATKAAADARLAAAVAAMGSNAPKDLQAAEEYARSQEVIRQQVEQAYRNRNWKLDSSGRAWKNDKTGVAGLPSLRIATEDAAKANEYVAALKAVAAAQESLQKATTTLNTKQEKLNASTTATTTDAYKDLLQIAQNLGVQIDDLGESFNEVDAEKLTKRLEELKTKGLLQVDRGLEEILNGFKNVSPVLHATGEEVKRQTYVWEEAATEMKFFQMQQQELASSKNRILSYFSVSGIINTFSKAIRSAYETVKELDAAMTKIAVVSDLSVNDMWGQLPKFTDQANKLGMAISDTYEATTLFVQQGLDLDRSMKLATETLKMAAVAGMDAAASTDAMTSALRGFNMELNEASAQRINDVYSELAAITAADTQELATAMSKVASLASSVNMEFETTAAFLAQGIETTREAAETIGTALKTVVARFSEVKSLYSEGELTGTDEEGEEVNVNRVQEALRAAGISMTEFLKGNEGLDKVFLRLSEKWDTLDVLTQRYIATQAAGSRQQSRFLAMMNNYSKTTELVNAAYNSAGSGEAQFEKTLDSLQAKLTKLKNAWDEFTMGLTNNELIGGVVEVLTTLLTTVNNIIDAVSGNSGLVKSILTLITTFGGLKLGGVLAIKALNNSFTNAIFEAIQGKEGDEKKQGEKWYEKGVKAAKKFREGFSGALKTTGQTIDSIKTGNGKQVWQGIKDYFYKPPKPDYSKVPDIKDSRTYIQLNEDEDLYRNAEINNLIESFKEGKIAIDDFKASLKNMEVDNIDEIVEQIEAIAETAGEGEIQWTNLSKSCYIAGATLTGIGTLISKIIPGGEALGEVIQKIGLLLTALGPIITLLGDKLKVVFKTIKAFKQSHPEIFALVVTLSALAAIIRVVVAAVENNSIEKRLKQAKEATQKAKEAAEAASQAYENLVDKKSGLDEMTSKLGSLTKGTIEWKKAIIDINNEILTLKDTYNNLKLGYDPETGMLSIENWDEIKESQLNQVKASNAVYALKQVDENNKLATKDKGSIPGTVTSKEEADARKNAIDYNKLVANRAALSSIIEGENAGLVANYLTTSTSYKKPTRRNPNSISFISGMNKIQTKAKETVDAYDDVAEAYDKTFGEGASKDLGQEEMKDTLTSLEVAKNAQEIANQISNLSEKEQTAFSLLGGGFSGTLSEVSKFTNLSNEDVAELAKILGYKEGELIKAINVAVEGIQEEKISLESKFNGLFGSYYEVPEGFYDQSFDVLKNLSNQVDGMGETAAKNYLKAFNDFVAEAKDKGVGESLANYLSTVDLTDAVEVSNAMDYMETLGLDKTEIEAFWRDINRSCKPYIKNLEQISTLSSKISDLGNVRELVSEGQQTFSSENKASLINVGFQEADFIQTGFDEWTYIGGETNSLLEQIDQKVGVISGQIVEGIENSIILGQQYSEIAPEDSQLYKDLKLLSEVGFTGTSFDEGYLRTMAEKLGIDVTNLSKEGVAQKLTEAFGLITNLEQNKKQMETQQMNAASLNYALNGDFGAYTEKLDAEGQQKAIEANLRSTAGALELYHKLLEDAGKAQDDFDLKLANEAIQLAKTTKRYKEAAKSIDSYKDALIQGDSAGVDYYSAIGSAKEDLANLFQIDKSLITDDFVKQYAQDIYNLAEGGEVGTAAFQKLWDVLNNIRLESLKKQVADLGGDVSQFVGWIDSLDPTIGIGTEISTEGLESGLKQMVVAAAQAGLDAKEALSPVISQLETITGTKIEINYEEETLDLNGKYVSAKAMDVLIGQGWTPGPGGKLIRIKSVSASKAGGGGAFTAPRLNTTSGNGSSDKTSTWLNPYDKLYNLTEQINEQLRQREKLEREYDRILERRGATFQELRKNYNNQLASLERELAFQERLREGRMEQLANVTSERYKGQDTNGNELIQSYAAWGVTEYANYDADTGVITIDWDAIDKVTDEEKGAAIEDYISRLEELQEQIEAIDEQVENFQDRILELQKEGMSDYLDFEQRVYDALVAQQQKLINDFQELSSDIFDNNKEILDDLQESIDLQRQIRDNTKTEEDLADKEARLAYLRRDTSNANLLEIKQLEDELADSRQDYEDSLIDQQLERLTKQNDDAQAAREKQIELMQAQLDYDEQNGVFWEEAYSLINSGFSANGELSAASQLWELLQNDEGWKGMSKFGQINWQEEISKAILAASQGYANWNMYKAQEIDKSLTLGDGTVLTYDGKDWKDSNSNTYNGVDYDSTQQQFTYEGMTPNPNQPSPTNPETENGNGNGSGDKKDIHIGSSVKADPNAKIYSNSYGGGGNTQYYANDPYYTVVDKNNDYFLTRYHKLYSGYTGWFKKKDLTAYKTGGIADFTGPAWLDGTKSKPELILNAKDTENFIMLKDILRSFMASRSTVAGDQRGDMYFDIDINVDEISNDYDVDELAGRVKKELTDAAMYRNVNLVNYIR